MKIKSLIKTTLMTVSGGILLQSMLMFSVQAEIFKCTNTKGAVYYNDKPCPIVDKEKKMQSEKDVVNGYVPPATMGEIKQRRKGIEFGGGATRFIGEGMAPESQGLTKSKQGGASSNGSGDDLKSKKKKKWQKQSKSSPAKGKSNPRASNKKVNGKFTIDQKRLMLGISPSER